MKKLRPLRAPRVPAKEKPWLLWLYVVDRTPKSKLAIANLKKFCEQYLAGNYRIEVIDLQENPKRASEDQIVALPTLVRRFPLPIRYIVGTMSDSVKVLAGLQVGVSG